MFNILNGGKHARTPRLPGVHGDAGRAATYGEGPVGPAPRSSPPSGRSSTTTATPRARVTRAGSRRRSPPTRAAVEVILRAIDRRATGPRGHRDRPRPGDDELVEEGSGAGGTPTRYRLGEGGQTLDSGELIDLWADWAARLSDRLDRGRPRRGRLDRLGRAESPPGRAGPARRR
jgi:hypothetical protein